MEVLNMPVARLVVAIAIFGLLLKSLKAYVTSGIKHIPGPWYSTFTESVLVWHTITGRRLFYIHELHRTYGPVVRISPEAVCVADPEAFHVIHKIGNGFVKSPWYRQFRKPDPSGSIDVFSSLDPRMHGAKRKLLARPFSNTSLRQHWEDIVIDKVKTTVRQIKEESKSLGHANIFKWWSFMTTDMIGNVAFGEDFRMSETGVKLAFVHDLDMIMVTGGIRAELPWAWNIFRAATLGLWNPLQSSDDRVRERSTEIMTKLNDRKLGRGNVFFGIQAAGEEEEKRTSHSVAYAAYEAQSLIVAGSGTTAVTLTYLLWAVLKQPQIQARLEAEVNALPEAFSDADLETLPYLNAVIRETLRLYGAAPGPLPRVNHSAPLRAARVVVPAGTTINTQAWTLHRNPEIFPDPEQFIPERWLNETIEMTSSFHPFGAGSRICLGIHLAHMELRHAAARFFRDCVGARIADAHDDRAMEVQHYFLIAPKGGTCNITV